MINGHTLIDQKISKEHHGHLIIFQQI